MRQMTSEKLQYIITIMVYYWIDTESFSSASRCSIETINFETPNKYTPAT